MQRLNDNDFQADLTAIPWDSAFVCDDIDDVWNHWSTHIKKEIRCSNKLYKIYRRNRNDETWSDHRVQRNLVSKLKRISIKRFCMDSAANATTPVGFWKRLKPLLPSSGQDRQF